MSGLQGITVFAKLYVCSLLKKAENTGGKLHDDGEKGIQIKSRKLIVALVIEFTIQSKLKYGALSVLQIQNIGPD